MSERSRPAVFTIPAGAPFLPILADALLDGRLAALDTSDPLALADATIYLPTRRAARAFRDVMLDRLGGEAAILPAIRPIGDVDEDEHLLDAPVAADDLTILPEALSPLARRLALTRLTLAWGRALRSRELVGLAEGEALAIPGSAGDAAHLAGALARLIDDIETAGIGWEGLARLAPEGHARYFQITLDFLAIVAEHWPAYLDNLGRADPAVRRDRLIREEARRRAGDGVARPVIAAGSTGSIPATAELLAAIARAPAGAVVLPGLDTLMDEATWRAVDGDGAPQAAAYAHPQFGLKRLIADIGVTRDEVVSLVPHDAASGRRLALVSEMMRPSETSDAWRARPASGAAAAALEGVDLVLARNEREEAAAIAVAMRATVEAPGRVAALVTPDRDLARRVAAELARWGLAVDDSAGASLDTEPAGLVCRLVAACMLPQVAPVDLLALLKHPLVRLGMAPRDARRAVRALEMAVLRGGALDGGPAHLPDLLARARVSVEIDDDSRPVRPPTARRQVPPEGWRLAADLADRLAEAFAPLAALGADGAVDLRSIATALTATLRALGRDAAGDDNRFWSAAGGEALARLLTELIEGDEAAALSLGIGEIAPFLAALMAEIEVPREPGGETRLHIWGTLEARLQSVDLLILGGLDEGVWPTSVRTDPWLSRAMRAELGLAPPERRLGLAAHDFAQGFAAPRVVCTRAEKRGGAPTVEARWLQRLSAVAGEAALAAARARGQARVALARMLDAVAATSPVRQPSPAPPPAARPRTLSITEIETLIRDPYAIYARRVLRLQPFEPLGAPADPALRGTLFHHAIGAFTRAWQGAYDEAARARLIAIADATLDEVAGAPDAHAIWTHRFGDIATWLIGWEAGRAAGVAARNAEIDGAWQLPAPAGTFTLRGRADRIDLMKDGTVAVYDFKTGTPQTNKTVFAGLTPQMTLEAAMVRAGAFEGVPAGLSVGELAWLVIGRVGRDDPYRPVAVRKETPDELAARARELLVELIAAYDDPARGYLSRARPILERWTGDYDHLARVREWSLQDAEEDFL